MNAPSVDIKDILEGTDALELLFKSNLFLAMEPPTPQNCVTIFDAPGGIPNLTFAPSEIYDRPSIQVRVRNIDYLIGYRKIVDIKDALHGKANFFVGSTYYSLIQCVTEPSFFDWDENSRARFVATFDIQRR